MHIKTVCQSPKFLVASICDLPDIINCQFREFAAALPGSHPCIFRRRTNSLEFTAWSSARSSCWIPNNLGGTWRRICSSDIRSVSALKVLRNPALQIDIYLLTIRRRCKNCNAVVPSLRFWRLLQMSWFTYLLIYFIKDVQHGLTVDVKANQLNSTLFARHDHFTPQWFSVVVGLCQKPVGRSFRPEVDAAHAQRGAGQRRAVSEHELVGDVAPTDVDVDAGRRVAAECDALYSLSAVLDQVDRHRRMSQGIVSTARRTSRVGPHRDVVDRSYAIAHIIIITITIIITTSLHVFTYTYISGSVRVGLAFKICEGQYEDKDCPTN